jgi:hypothetical protein
VTPQMLSDAWQLLSNCPNYTHVWHCQDAIDAEIGLLRPSLPQDLRERMFPLVFELAAKELTVHALTKFDVSLGSKGMYEKVPSGMPGVTQYVLKSDISDVAFVLRLLTSLTSNPGMTECSRAPEFRQPVQKGEFKIVSDGIEQRCECVPDDIEETGILGLDLPEERQSKGHRGDQNIFHA